MKTAPGIAFLEKAVAEEIEAKAAQTRKTQAEGNRHKFSFPNSQEPDALVAEGRLVNVSILAHRAATTAIAARGFRLDVFATAAVGDAAARIGLERILEAAWWCCSRDGLPDGIPRKPSLSQTSAFGAAGPDGTDAFFFYAFGQRPDGGTFGLIYIRGEANPLAAG